MISAVAIFLLPFWLIRNIKYILFWIYLWQLKQYHRGRFYDYFRTEKGKKLLYQPIQGAKILLVLFFLAAYFSSDGNLPLVLPAILFFIYFAESFLYSKAFFAKKSVNPQFTKKTKFLFAASLAVALILFFIATLFFNIFWFALAILIFDILLPAVVSLVVIVFQPLADRYRLSLQKKAKEKIKGFKNLKIIAITGSYAKTSTKEFLTTILSSKFKVLASKEHQNTEIAIPQMILNELNPEHQVLIIEMGAYDKGTIKRVCDFALPKIGIVTGVNSQHLALFGSMENLLSAEGGRELLDCLPKDGALIVNGENNFCQDLYQSAKIKKIKYSYGDAQDIKVEKDSVSFKIGSILFRANVFGKHNVLNLLGAIAIAREMGMDLSEIAEVIKKIRSQQLSFKVSKNSSGVFVVDSTYSANPDGVIADLDYLKLYSGKRAIIMPCLIELGDSAKEVHQKIGRKISEVCDLAIVTTKECFQDVKEGAVKTEVINSSDPNFIAEKTKSFSAILLEGRISETIINKIKK